MRFSRFCAVVVVLTAAVFAVGITGGHLGADDWGYTYGCRFVKDGLSWANAVEAFRDPAHGAIWMPLTYCTYMADISLFGGGWPVHHAVNVFLHAVNAGLVFAFILMLVRRFSGEPGRAGMWICAWAALVWSLHPMRAEAVTYVASRKEELWTMFALLGLFAWARFQVRGRRDGYVWALACFVLSCLSKPTAVCFVPLAYLVQVVLTGQWRRRLLGYVPFLVLAFGVGVLALYSQAHPTGAEEADVFNAGLGWRMLNAGVSVGLYLFHTIAPTGIHLDYRAVFGGWPVDGGLGLAVLAAAVLATAGVVLYGTERIRRSVVFSAAWFLFGLLPTLGVFGYVNGDQACADRYTYLPAIAFSVLLALGALRVVRGKACRFCLLAMLGLVVLETVAVLPVIASFKDDYAAFSRALKADPEHWRALRIVGNEYCARRGRMGEGVTMLRRSLRARNSQRTADSLAYVLAIRGQPGDFAEVKRLGAAVAHDFRRDVHGMMLDALAIAYMREGDDRNAAKLFKASLGVPRRNHSPGHSLLNLGLTLANLGRDAEARMALGKAANDANPEVRTRAAEALSAIRAGVKRSRFSWKP